MGGNARVGMEDAFPAPGNPGEEQCRTDLKIIRIAKESTSSGHACRSRQMLA